jgi:MFS family permease
MLVGALFWGLGADIIGRRIAFNTSLFICSAFAIVAGASPNWFVLGLFTCLSAFGAGGNLVLDTAVFLEYLPSNKQWLLTLLACWRGLAPVIGAAFAWPFLSEARWNCTYSKLPCNYHNNQVHAINTLFVMLLTRVQGWRYVWYSNGVLVLKISALLALLVSRSTSTTAACMRTRRKSCLLPTEPQAMVLQSPAIESWVYYQLS